MKRLVGIVAVAALSSVALSACGGGGGPAPNVCTGNVIAPKYSNFDVYGAGVTECVYKADLIHLEVQVLFWTFWGWRTLGFTPKSVYGQTSTSATAAWPCKGTSVHEFKTSVSGYEVVNGVHYDQLPNPQESDSSYLKCDPAEGW